MTFTPDQLARVAKVLGVRNVDDVNGNFAVLEHGSPITTRYMTAGELCMSLLRALAKQKKRVDITQHNDGDCRVIIDSGRNPVGYGDNLLSAVIAGLE